MSRAFVIAIVGAESTGKSTLALALRDALAVDGARVALVAEALREFCASHARTPQRSEQPAIAAEQTSRIDSAAKSHDIVVADTSALMVAVYSDVVFGDRSLYDSALLAQRACNLTLLTALDLPWVADGLQRDGAHVRAPVDALLRAALLRHAPGYAVISGHGPARVAAALAATHAAAPAATNPATGRVRHPPGGAAPGAARWYGVCERCGDTDCEWHLLARP
jgi:nicotinamide riboside kinase